MKPAGPFHTDELAAQRLAGGGAPGGSIRAEMPSQHRAFFAGLPCIFAATADEDGWPLATVLAGAPGFVSAPDPVTLRIAARPDPQDPAAACFGAGQKVGVLGLDLSTRRRNRANGIVTASDVAGFTLAVQQSFGNCAKYIQRRTSVVASRTAQEVEALDALDAAACDLIAGADTFFVASRSRGGVGATGGADMSHRGGRPGFVRVDGGTLSIPDFAGNRYYNTFGNFMGEPRGSLLFVDFARGDVLQLQGIAEIDWTGDEAGKIEGAERIWHFNVTRGWRRRATLPLSWAFVDYAPSTERTGTWDGAAQLSS